jgi:hypothetical protein
MTAEFSNITQEEKFGKEYSKTFTLKAEGNGVSMKLDMEVIRIIEWMTMPKSTAWDQHYYRFLNKFTLDVVLDGVADRVEGETLTEMMLL